MHDDVHRVEERIARQVFERIVPLIERDRRPVTARATGPDGQTRLIEPGDGWGPPWATTLFELAGDIPDEWSSAPVALEIDLGFTATQAGFQCEGLVIDENDQPVQGIHPRRTRFRVASEPGPVRVRVEAASNPSFPSFVPSPMGHPATAADVPLYRFGGARLVRLDPAAEALVHDLDVLAKLMVALAADDPRRARIRSMLAAALDAAPDLGAMSAALAPALTNRGAPNRHTIVATGHAHIDTAWLWPISETVRKCTRTFASAVGLLDTCPEHRFACSQAQQYAWIEESQPALFQRIADQVAAGRWEPVGGMWVEPDMNLPSGESLVRQIVQGQRYFESRFGRRCTEAWIPDVFGYPASLPQLFAAGGLRRFVTQKLSWNTSNRFPHHTFWWEGLDGTRVLTHFPPVDTYNAEITPEECIGSVSRFREAAWSDWSLMPFGFGDGGGGPTTDMVERARRLSDLDGTPRVQIGTPADFFARVESEAAGGAPVPVWRGELYLETHRGTLTSQLATKAGNRRCAAALCELEWWAAVAGETIEIDSLWQRVLTQQFHDILPGSSIAWVHEQAEAEHAAVLDLIESRRCDLVERVVPAGDHLVNSSAVDRDEVVEHLGQARRWRIGAGEIRPIEQVGEAVSGGVTMADGSMSNEHLAIRFTDTGTIASFISIEHGRELVPPGASFAALELAVDHPVRYDAWDLESWVPGLGRALETPEAVTSSVLDGAIGRIRVDHELDDTRIAVVFELCAGQPYLDISIEMDWQHREHLLSMVFPLDVRADLAACDIQFGHVMRPTHPSNSWEAARFEVCAHRFVDLSEPSFGVAILNDGRYGHGLFDGRIRTSLARAARYPDPNADRGRHRVTFRVLPHGPGMGAVVDEAQRLTQPLRVVSGSASVTPEPPVRVEGHGIEVDVIKPADDGSGDLVVRLHEALGDRSTVSLLPRRPLAAAWRCNLLEESEAGVDASDGVASLTLRPFELVTLRLQGV